MLSAQYRGRLFEDKVDETLKSHLRNYDIILREKEIKTEYGANISAIDHLIRIEEYIFCIQSKWAITSRLKAYKNL
jgi:hypothetical protein